jgi:hypothetical protein
MRRQRYPFYQFQYPDGRLTPAWRIYLPLRITNQAAKKSILLYGLADTGADASLFPASLAIQLGHNLKGTGVKSSMTCGIEQNDVTTYRHTFKLELLTPDTQRVVRAFNRVEIDCAETNPPILLGASDFLSRFDISIHYRTQETILTW